MKLPITKDEFITLYQTKSNKYIQEKYGLSYYVITKIAKNLNLKEKRKGRPLRYEF